MTQYRLIRREEIAFEPALPERSRGLTRALLIGGHTGATHTGLMSVALEDGHVDTHLHSFESSFYVLSGEPVLYLDGRGVRLRPNTCGAIPVGVPHAWRSDARAEWIEMASPRPRPPDQPRDTFFLGPAPDDPPADLDLRDPRNGELHTMAVVVHGPGAVAHPHDHPFEESSYMLEGEVDIVADGDRHTLRPGDVFWAGVGCLHAFSETRGGAVKWLETSAPGPPDRHSYRFERDWEDLAERV